MLQPRRVKHRKHHRGRMKGKATSGNVVSFGRVRSPGAGAGLDRLPPDRGRPPRHDARDAPRRQGLDPHLPDKPVTAKPAETRMGSGKGNPEKWVAVVKPNRVLFEIAGVPEEIAREALRLAAHSFPSPRRSSSATSW